MKKYKWPRLKDLETKKKKNKTKHKQLTRIKGKKADSRIWNDNQGFLCD